MIVMRLVVDEYETLYRAPTGTSTASNLVWICDAKAEAEYWPGGIVMIWKDRFGLLPPPIGLRSSTIYR